MTEIRPTPGSWIDLLADTAARVPDRVAFRHLADGETPAGELTYAQLDTGARAVAARLQALGLRGREVVLLYPSGLDYVTAFFGCLYAGAVAVPAYPPTRQPRSLARIVGIVADCGAGTVLTTTAFAAKLGSRMPAAAALRVVTTDDVPLDGVEPWSRPVADADTLAFIQYTSGSTSNPRGVLLTHGNLLSNAAVTQRLFRTGEDTRIVSWLPMYHDMGLIGSVLGTVHSGGSCVLMSPSAFAQRPGRWLEAISRFGATASGAPNFAYDLCVDRIGPEERARLDLSSWEVAFNGAEPLRPSTLRRFAEAFADSGFRAEALTPCYGLAEATLLVTGKRWGTPAAVDKAPPSDGAPVVSSGIPADDVRVEIVDAATHRPAEPGAVGEIWVDSPGTAHGYLGHPELSEATFGATLAGTPGPRFLRTGDLGYLAEGELHVVGRLKDLVVVRGRNHYPQDIERTAELSHEALRPGGGAAFPVTVGGEEHLALVHELDRSFEGDLDEVVTAARAGVAAEHRVRPHSVVLIRAGSLPRTSSGKVQRRACRAELLAGSLKVLLADHDDGRTPDDEQPYEGPPAADSVDLAVTDPAEPTAAGGASDPGAAAPDPGAEARILAFLREQVALILRGEDIVPDRPLLELGLDSLGTVDLQHRIAGELGLAVDLEEELTSTLTELAASLAARPHGTAERRAAPPDASRTADGELLLTPAQQAQWLGHRLAPDSTAQVIAAAVAVRGTLDADALRRALDAAAARHPALRTTFHATGDGPVGHVHDELRPEYTLHDAPGTDPAALDEELARAAYRPFDLEHGPLLRAVVFRLAEDDHRLVLAVHHIAADLWSLEVLLADLDRLYPAALAGEPLTAEAVGEAPRTPEGAERDRLLTYWKEELAGAPTLLPLPADLPRTDRRRLHGAAEPFRLGARTSDRLTALAAARGTTRYTVLLAAYQVLLARITGRRDLLVATPVHGRAGPREAASVALYADMVPLRGRIRDEEDFTALLARTHGVVRSGIAHTGLGISSIAGHLAPERAPGRPALAQAVFTLHRPVGRHGALLAACALGLPGPSGALGPLTLEAAPFTPPAGQFETGVTLAEIDGELHGVLHHDTDLFLPATARGWADQFVTLLERVTADPGTRLADLLGAEPARTPSAAGEETRRLRPVHEMFADRAALAPHRTAVVWEGGELTYRELDVRANRLAHRLIAEGVGPESMVGICLPRSPDMVVAVLAVAKAGGAYVPLDPGHPAERIRHVLDDTAPRVLVSTATAAARLPALDATLVDLDAEAEALAALPGDDPGVPGDLDRLAYVIHTSGSSGRPKGVLVPCRGVASLFAGGDFRFDHTDVWTLFHSYTFDFSVWELWGPLVHGGLLVVVPTEATLSPPAFWDLIEKRRVTVLNQTPAVFAELTAAAPDRLSGLDLRHVVFGGERLEAGQLAVWRAHGDPATRLVNMYGITEITVHATYGPLAGHEDAAQPPLGGPLPGTDVRLLDEDGRPVAAGEPGEICVGGHGVARGYLGRPALTAERFVPHPDRPGRRMYRSGDLGRTGPDGALEYLGRADDQVKIRGHRIEPGEITAALRTHPGLRDACVLADRDARGQVRLTGYVVPDGPQVPAAELRAHLRDRLPEYLVPGGFRSLEALPLTANGKTDRRVLLALEERPAHGEAPATPTELEVGRTVDELLGVTGTGRDDDLFALGWHSLLMARLSLRVEERYGARIPLQELFTAPTVARIAAAVDEALARPAVPVAPAGGIARADRSRYAAPASSSGRLRLPDSFR
ncbi:non-ribosomal peptide synthetase [Streptomyces sp. CS227]|uniref:non-ribosomal peptide synthetase n=1 Tax=Streptomyces sp. CS227 TaxID=1982763 RepID=UPI00118084A8|nr:non-ribosomal peptide synthetase [Streptomyces sp. CS227]